LKSRNPEISGWTGKPKQTTVQFEFSGFRDLRCRIRPISKFPFRAKPSAVEEANFSIRRPLSLSLFRVQEHACACAGSSVQHSRSVRPPTHSNLSLSEHAGCDRARHLRAFPEGR